MRRRWHKHWMLAIALLLFGTARMPFESGLAAQLRSSGLIPPRVKIGTLEKIGQTSAAVALGGLRTLVATFLNLRAFSFFEIQKWNDVGDVFELIVDLAPKTIYYWETGSWHQAYNASSFYLNDSELSPLRKKEAWRASVLEGRAFLERGIRNNPDEWRLYASLGFLLTDANKFSAFRDDDATFAAATLAYRRARETGNALDYVARAEFYALARVVGREKEALELAQSLYTDPKNHTPTLLVLLFVLESHQMPEMKLEDRAIEIFGSAEAAYQSLKTHWQRTREKLPIHGVAAALTALEERLKIPPEESVFNESRPARE